MAGRYNFSEAGRVLNQGSIKRRRVCRLSAPRSNEGKIRLNRTVALARASARWTSPATAANVATKGRVTRSSPMAAAARDSGECDDAQRPSLLRTRSPIRRQRGPHAGESQRDDMLLGDMGSGTMAVSGVLDASAPNGGDGGFIETSAARVDIADGVRVTTAAAQGKTGTWLIDPADFTIGAGGNISGATLSAQLVTNSVVISTFPAPGDNTPGNGDIHVNDAIAWTASGTPTRLTRSRSQHHRADSATNGISSPAAAGTSTSRRAHHGNVSIC